MGNRLFIVMLLALGACQGPDQKGNPEGEAAAESQKFGLPESEYAIIPFDTRWYWLFAEAKPTMLSTPALSAIEEIIEKAVLENEALQRAALANHHNAHPGHHRAETGHNYTLAGYKRQYVPVINKKGEKEIWVNFFCDDWGDKKWRSEIHMVEDGGSCYFSLKINLAQKAYSALRINGSA